MNRGRITQGEYLALSVLCRTSPYVAANPVSAPEVSIYDATFTKIVTDQKMPPKDLPGAVGFFEIHQPIDSTFSEGHYTALYRWWDGASSGSYLDRFEVVGGGCSAGASTAMQFYRRPDSDWIATHSDINGTFTFRKNPRLRP
jgi:hypothetical protein